LVKSWEDREMFQRNELSEFYTLVTRQHNMYLNWKDPSKDLQAAIDEDREKVHRLLGLALSERIDTAKADEGGHGTQASQ